MLSPILHSSGCQRLGEGLTIRRNLSVQNVLTTWNALGLGKRLVVIGATVAVFLAVLALARIAGQPRMALLYAGLDSAAAGEVIAALDAQRVAYSVEGDSIRVEASRRDELRMILAGEGLPAQGTAGYELLDGLSGFGTTSQMFDAAYWRAKEGEIARTILAMPGVRAARVHLSRAPAQPFVQGDSPTASVTVTMASGSLTSTQARALRHLISSAVSGLRPEMVSVIDSSAGLIAIDDDAALPANTDAREAELKRNVERLLSARLGPGRSVVEVSMDVVSERESVTERRFDPQSRVAISSDSEERNDQSTQPGGDVTVASNLPEGDAAAGANGQSQSSLTRERVNYEVSETSRLVEKVPGDVRRLTVAVLIDAETVTAADGTQTLQPRADEEIAALRDLVASAVGLSEERGDVLTIKSMAFQPLAEAGSGPADGYWAGLTATDVMSLIQLAVLALVALLLGIFVVRPVLKGGSLRQQSAAAGAAPLALPNGATALDDGVLADGPLRVLTGEIDDGDLASLQTLSGEASDLDTDPVSRLRRLIAERQSESIEILRGWMEAEQEKA